MSEINILSEILNKLDVLTEQNEVLRATIVEQDQLLEVQKESYENLIAELHDEILELKREQARERGFNPALAYKCYQHGIQGNFSVFSNGTNQARFEQKGAVIPKLAKQKLANISEQMKNMKLGE